MNQANNALARGSTFCSNCSPINVRLCVDSIARSKSTSPTLVGFKLSDLIWPRRLLGNPLILRRRLRRLRRPAGRQFGQIGRRTASGRAYAASQTDLGRPSAPAGPHAGAAMEPSASPLCLRTPGAPARQTTGGPRRGQEVPVGRQTIAGV